MFLIGLILIFNRFFLSKNLWQKKRNNYVSTKRLLAMVIALFSCHIKHNNRSKNNFQIGETSEFVRRFSSASVSMVFTMKFKYDYTCLRDYNKKNGVNNILNRKHSTKSSAIRFNSTEFHFILVFFFCI